MDVTFGIITSNVVNSQIIDSIVSQNINNFEIIVIGGNNEYENSKIKHIEFDESKKRNWITKKKNYIIEEATFENIVFSHDYYKFSENWYENQKHIVDFDVCMNRILNLDGTRFRDWCVWDDPELCFKNGHSVVLPNYSYSETKYMYISGGFWIAKKEFMKKNKLDENLSWGEGEDVEWSKRIRENFNYIMNDKSIVNLTKYKGLSAILV